MDHIETLTANEIIYHSRLNKLTFILIFVAICSCDNIPDKRTSINSSHDSIAVHPQYSNNFQFNIQEIKSDLFHDEFLCFVHLSYSNRNYFLFETTEQYKNENLQHLFGNYYAFPYFTGGNYCRAIGINVIKVTEDTAFFIGPVSGYDDIDSNGVKELYIDVTTDLTGAHINHKIEQFEVFLVNDLLVYQEIDLY